MAFARITAPSEALLWLRLAVQQRSHRRKTGLETWSAATFDGVSRCCLFIGHPRSGHSLIGSLIDAHPNAIMAHRLDLLGHLERGASRTELFAMALRNSQTFARRDRGLTGYAYPVPGQWQGRFTSLALVGDQEGEKTVQRLQRDPGLLERATATFGTVRFIHVVRNPFDNITTIALRAFRGLDYAIARYLRLCEAVEQARWRIGPDRCLEVGHEAFVADPKAGLVRVLTHLDLPIAEAFLADCATGVCPTPHRSRFRMRWGTRQKDDVLRACDRYDFLHGYGFDDG